MIRCLVVDDEAPARALIELHLSALPEFEVVGSLANALEAFAYLQKHTVDLLFLDINMPKLSGLELLKSLKSSPKVILTTAYCEHAVEAFELEVFDYLVKPITQPRFMKAIAKFLNYRSEMPADNDDVHYFLKVGRGQVKVLLKDILYIEGLADYIKVHTSKGDYTASEKLGFMETQLPGHLFSRVHKSFIVSLNRISSYSADRVTVEGQTLPIGRLFKAGFLKAIQSRV